MGKKMMIIGVETLSKILDWSDRSTCVLFGDGAGCAIVEADEEREIFIDAGSDGARGDVLTCEERHLNNLLVKDDSPMQQVAMDGQEVFKFATCDARALDLFRNLRDFRKCDFCHAVIFGRVLIYGKVGYAVFNFHCSLPPYADSAAVT